MTIFNHFTINLIFLTSITFTQIEECGVNTIEHDNHWEQPITSLIPIVEEILVIGVKAYLVLDDNGESDFTTEQIYYKLQEAFGFFNYPIQTGINFQLNIENIVQLPDTEYYNCIDCNNDEDIYQYNDPTKLNIYLVNNLTINGNNYSGWGDYHENNFIVTYSATTRTIAHEAGHCFWLYHPFIGSDNINPELRERVVRPHEPTVPDCEFNCYTNGDYLCDTPADTVYGSVNSDCVFDIERIDTCDNLYEPDTHNIMSYYGNCRNSFSNEQIIRMHDTINNYLSGIVVPLDDIETIDILFVNRNTASGEILAGNIKIFGGLPMGENYYLSASNEIVTLFTTISYTLVADEIVLNEVTELFFHHWGESNFENINLLDRFIPNSEISNRVANFKVKFPTTITSNFPENLYIFDPWWFDDDGIQKGFIPISDWNSQLVFLNEIPNPDDASIPYYKINAENYYYNSNYIYSFIEWEFNDVMVNEESESEIIFMSNNSSLSTQFISVNNIEDYIFTIYPNSNLLIPGGAFLDFAFGFNLIVEGFLAIKGEEYNPVFLNFSENSMINLNLNNSSQKQGLIINNCKLIYEGGISPILINCQQATIDPSIIVNNSVFINSSEDLSASGLSFEYSEIIETEVHILELINTTHFHSGITVSELIDYSQPVYLINNVFYEGILGGDNWNNDICYNNFYNVNFDDGISTTCEEEIGEININPGFVDLTNFTLNSNSPCIDSGDPDRIDPDGTQSDIGAYYFHQIKADINRDTSIDIFDITLIVQIILDLYEPTYNESWCADIDDNDDVSIFDIILALNIIYDTDEDFSDNGSTIFLSSIIEEFETETGIEKKLVIQMLNEIAVSALHMEINVGDNYAITGFEGGTKTQNMERLSNTTNNNKNVGFIFYGATGNRIETGAGSIAEIPITDTGLGRNDGESEEEFLLVEMSNDGETYLDYVIIHPDSLGKLAEEYIESSTLPSVFALHSAYPNPFNPVTTIRYDIPYQTKVTISIFDIIGRKVTTLVNEKVDAGYKSVKWDASNISTGIYLIRMTSVDYTKTQKVMLLK